MIAPLRRFAFLAALLLAPALFAADTATPAASIELFNGRDLAGWIPVTRQNETADPGTWTAADGILRCTGKPTGYLRTDKSYKNYRLTVEWRWAGPDLAPDAQGRPRLRNSGVLVHMQAPDNVWPKAFEAQLMQTKAGDIYDVGYMGLAELVLLREKALAEAGSDPEAIRRAKALRRVPSQKEPSEKPVGEWNTGEIVCSGDTLSVRINGVDQNRVTKAGASQGYIALQSEGAPVEFRHIRLTPLE